jgi:hypothetical protein
LIRGTLPKPPTIERWKRRSAQDHPSLLSNDQSIVCNEVDVESHDGNSENRRHVEDEGRNPSEHSPVGTDAESGYSPTQRAESTEVNELALRTSDDTIPKEERSNSDVVEFQQQDATEPTASNELSALPPYTKPSLRTQTQQRAPRKLNPKSWKDRFLTSSPIVSRKEISKGQPKRMPPPILTHSLAPAPATERVGKISPPLEITTRIAIPAATAACLLPGANSHAGVDSRRHVGRDDYLYDSTDGERTEELKF